MAALDKLKSVVKKVELGNALAGGSASNEDSPTIKVCIRVRPFIKEELEGQRSGGETKLCIEMPTETTMKLIQVDDPDEEPRVFEFDRCFWSHTEDHPLFANQETLQKELGSTMLDHAMNGFNNCIFAYGQTGSGKSFSVLGGKGEARGLLPRVVEGLFDHFEKLPEGATYKTLVAFMEIYNEQIRDLLSPNIENEAPKKLEVKQHPVLGTIIPGLTEAAVASCEEVLKLVDYGTTMRHVSSTAMNATSSRSHCIFTFKTSLTVPGEAAKVSQTHLVDLAGSERAGRTKATGDRLKEGAAINQSLSTLARVISELAKKQKKKTNPPFRESKLTYILKESLSGNSRTVMMAAISPNFLDYDETLSTLKFAQSVKLVQTKAVQNSVNMSSVEAQLRKELNDLKAQLQAYEAAEGEKGGVNAETSKEELDFLKRRLEEQEQLCAYYGKDWDSLLAEERLRTKRRSTLVELQSTGRLPKAGGMLNIQEDDDDPNRKLYSDDEDESSWTCPLILLGKPEDAPPPEGRPSLRVQIRSSIAAVGPTARDLMGDSAYASRADTLNREMFQHQEKAAEAEKLLSAADPVGAEALGVRLRVLLIVDPDEANKYQASLVVQAWTTSTSLPSCAWSWKDSLQDEAQSTDWCSLPDLTRRLEWLQSQTPGSFRSSGEFWAAAAEATSGRPTARKTEADPAELEAKLRKELEAEWQEEKAQMTRQIASLQKRLEAAGQTFDAKESSGTAGDDRSAKARDVAKAIASSFETAIGAIDAAQIALKKVGLAESSN
eukprot:TRINITY_DN92479_c0_g1_i1.p1 TRINITY_DN92479_c0_g1~~TRINITY_DN92479_c0_g1_i1.p1  ORF type:complete len:778 (+),score=189.98 TRINITY_DN92479_c0_g1_i1:47-2380(+)